MKKTIKSVAGIFLAVLLVFTAVLPVFAETPEHRPEIRNISIQSAENFFTFAKNCILDTYSENLVVNLEADLDLTGSDFSGIPIFSGTFEGNGHTIKGISLVGDGSDQGLFRYLLGTASIKNLKVIGEILPNGSRNAIGGIAGSNAGIIIGCSFYGEVSGNNYVGGLVGTNQVSGILENCQSGGTIAGNHFIGGIAGENLGVIRNCSNEASINTSSKDNSVALSDITAETITGTEQADTVTDIGGIAGTSTGVIRGCKNTAAVGYPHMGYNIGGIAGSQKGLISDCENYGEICGRKEVGGIVGQMEPIANIEYAEDTLQILQHQLENTSALANQAGYNIHNNSESINQQISQLQEQASAASEAVGQLIPDPENHIIPDWDTITAARNTLSSNLSAMGTTLDSIAASAQDGITTISNDIKAITNQIGAMSQTIGSATENIGGSITDISDLDTAEDLTGKVFACKNLGSVDGDLNIGGIVGASARENDLDPEDDLQFNGNSSLNFDSELRAVVLSCENHGVISGKKKNIGGIVGKLSLGLIKECINAGSVGSNSAEYVGGITGISSGYIRTCSSKSQLSGKYLIGGIAGSAPIVTNCLSMTDILQGREKTGSILGQLTKDSTGSDNPVFGNHYITIEEDFGGIDGVCYAGMAQSLDPDAFLELDGVPDLFRKTTVTFLFEDGTSKEVSIPLGDVLKKDQIPPLPPKNGYVANWDKFKETNPEKIKFDSILKPDYTACQTVIQSENLRDSGAPVFLAEGQFDGTETLKLESFDGIPDLPSGMYAVETWQLPQFPATFETQVRLSIPDNVNSDETLVWICSLDGNWSEVPSEAKGSYRAFTVKDGDQAVCLVYNPDNADTELFALIGILVICAALIIIVLIRRKKKTEKALKSPDNEKL